MRVGGGVSRGKWRFLFLKHSPQSGSSESPDDSSDLFVPLRRGLDGNQHISLYFQ